MDSGFLADGETLDDEFDVLQEISPEQVVGLMDEMMSFEVSSAHPPYLERKSDADDRIQMAWHKGYPLSQTLFTSLYIDRLLWPEPKTLAEASFDRDTSSAGTKSLLHAVLRPWCLGIIKTCDFVYKKISSEHYYEVCTFCRLVSILIVRRKKTSF